MDVERFRNSVVVFYLSVLLGSLNTNSDLFYRSHQRVWDLILTSIFESLNRKISFFFTITFPSVSLIFVIKEPWPRCVWDVKGVLINQLISASWCIWRYCSKHNFSNFVLQFLVTYQPPYTLIPSRFIRLNLLLMVTSL